MNQNILDWMQRDVPPWPMPDAQIYARAAAEGALEDFRWALIHAQQEGVEAALARKPLPDWLAQIVRSQFPAH